MVDKYERVLLVKHEVFVYRIPPLSSTRGYRAAEWKLDNPDWVGRLRLVLGRTLELRLEDKTSGQLFAKCPIDKYPGPAIEAVLDSSRYFVVRLQDDSGRSAFVGIGFADRSDSFDLNVALQDHFKSLAKDEQLIREMAEEQTKPKLDLSFKDGQTITLNIGKKPASAKPRPHRTTGNIEIPPLPPPPGISPKVQPRNQQQLVAPSSESASATLFDENNPFSSTAAAFSKECDDILGELKSAVGSAPPSSNGASSNSLV